MGKTTAQRNSEWDRTKRTYLEAASRRLGAPLTPDARASSRWGRSPAGPFAILGADEVRPNRWWFGLLEERFREARVLGAVLLCRKGEQLLDFGLPAARLRPLLPHLSREGTRGERKLNVQRLGSRYVLRVPGRQDLDLDLTDAKGDLSWLGAGPESAAQPAPDAHERVPRMPAASVRTEEALAASASLPVAFFARVRKRVLEPLDDSGLEDGAVVLVTAVPAKHVPASSAMRRIVARGGPSSLPADLAEKHDFYARQTSRS